MRKRNFGSKFFGYADDIVFLFRTDEEAIKLTTGLTKHLKSMDSKLAGKRVA